MDGDVKLAAALIAAIISLIGVGCSLVTARWQVQGKLEELTQVQFKEVLSKRVEVYPLLWDILMTFVGDWKRAEKDLDYVWARSFFERLLAWNSVNGVFLSQSAYEKFAELRARAWGIVRACDRGQSPTREDLAALEAICAGDSGAPLNDPKRYGLATWMKNDLGSYKTPALAVRRN